MPFPEQPARPFTQDGVAALVAGQQGAYGLLRGDRWIFVGWGDIQECLLAHLGESQSAVMRAVPTHYVAAVTPNAEARGRQLVAELRPSCNANSA